MRERLVRNIAFGKSVFRSTWKIGSLEIAIQVLAFVTSIVKFRYFQAEVMGILGYYTALSQFPSIFYGSFTRLYIRFMPTATPRRQGEIFLAGALYQIGFLILLGVLILPVMAAIPGFRLWNGRITEGGANYGYIFWFLIAVLPLSMSQGILAAAQRSLQRYSAFQAVNLAFMTVMILGTLAVTIWVTDRQSGMRALLWLQIAATGGAVSMLALDLGHNSTLWSETRQVLPAWRSICKNVYHAYIKGYTLPLQFTAIFAYVKENVAVIILGQAGMMSDAGLYNVATKIYTLPRKFIPGLVDVFMPRMVLSAGRDPEMFKEKYGMLSWAQFLSFSAIGTLIFLALPLFGMILNIENSQSLKFVFYLFSINLLVSSIAQINKNIIMLGEDTRWFFLTSLVRSIMVTLITAILIPAFKSTGASLALVISSLFVAIMLSIETRKSNKLAWRSNALQFASSVVIALAWAIDFWL